MTFADAARAAARAAALLAATLPSAAAAEGLRGAQPLPGLPFVEARVLAIPGPGQYIVRARPRVSARRLEGAAASLCGTPARATYLYRDKDRRPGDVTYLVRCRP